MKLLVDGVFFQMTNTGIARVWRSVLERLVRRPEFEIFFLDRGHAPVIEGLAYIPFPTHSFAYSADESILLQHICDTYQIDVFTSTYYTTPLNTPMILMIHDMIPELFGFDLAARGWMEKDTAISYAQRYICVSHNTRDDLLSFYPDIPEDKVCVAWNGVDTAVFKLRPEDSIAAFKRQYGLDRPYFLFVGSRVQHNGYKNSRIFFEAVSRLKTADFDVFCVGGEKDIEGEVLGMIPEGVRCSRVELTDEELSLAYNGAIALVYPSLYEGFGMPVTEAMASGCPVITTPYGSLAEAAGNAACLVDGTSVDDMRAALERVRDPDYRESLKQAGLEHAKQFSWDAMADKFAEETGKLHAEANAGDYAGFFQEWRRLREIQATVDF